MQHKDLPTAPESGVTSSLLSTVNRDTFVARQPVLTSGGEVFAYDVRFRNGIESIPADSGGDSTALLAAFIDGALDRLVSDRRVLIHFTESMLLDGTATLFPRERLIVQLPASIAPNPEAMAACQHLAEAGYEIVLGSFEGNEAQRALLRVAAMVKVDFGALPAASIEAICQQLRQSGTRILAERVDDHDTLELARSFGCELFQGYFFSKPEVVESKSLQSSRLQLVQLLAEVNGPAFDVASIEKAIQADIAISYKLLRYINSAMFRRAREVSSIKHAITLLGRTEFRKFISLLLAGEIADHKPLELTRLALTRGKFCELLAQARDPREDSAEFFLLGLLSLLDAMLDIQMSEVIGQLPLQERMKQALLSVSGPCAPYLELAVACEMGDWDAIDILEENEAEPTLLYWEAVEWADDMMDARAASD